jgi:hypothetical protein
MLRKLTIVCMSELFPVFNISHTSYCESPQCRYLIREKVAVTNAHELESCQIYTTFNKQYTVHPESIQTP